MLPVTIVVQKTSCDFTIASQMIQDIRNPATLGTQFCHCLKLLSAETPNGRSYLNWFRTNHSRQAKLQWGQGDLLLDSPKRTV